MPSVRRFEIPLRDRFERKWQFYRGKKGGFVFSKEEENFKARGIEMIKKCEKYEEIISGNGEYVGCDPEMKRDLYFVQGKEKK